MSAIDPTTPIAGEPQQLLVNGEEHFVSTLDEHRPHLQAARAMPFAEVWLNHDRGNSLALLLNAEYGRAYMEFTALDVQSGDPDYTGEEIKAALRRQWEEDGEEWTEEVEAEPVCVEFELSNGQIDDIAAERTMPADAAVAAFEHFFLHREPDPAVSWERTLSMKKAVEQILGRSLD